MIWKKIYSFKEGEKIFKNYIKINNENLSAKEVATIIK